MHEEAQVSHKHGKAPRAPSRSRIWTPGLQGLKRERASLVSPDEKGEGRSRWPHSHPGQTSARRRVLVPALLGGAAFNLGL